MGLAGFTLADRLGAKSSPCSVPGARAPGSRSPAARAPSSAGAARPIRTIPPRRCAIPCREKFARRDGRRARPAIGPGCDGTWTWPRDGAARGVRHQAAAAARAVRRLRGEAGRARGQAAPLRGARAARARRSSRSARSCWPARPTSSRATAGAPLRAVRGRLPQAQGPRRSAAASTAASSKWTWTRRRADPGLRQRAAQRSAAPHVRDAARPTSARSPTARSAAAPRAARRPGPGRAAISSTPAWPASRRPRRRTGCARAASTSTRR